MSVAQCAQMHELPWRTKFGPASLRARSMPATVAVYTAKNEAVRMDTIQSATGALAAPTR